MTVLGIDPGTAIVGFSVIGNDTGEPGIITYGQITTDKKRRPAERLEEIYENINELIVKYSPQELAIEKLYFHRNVTTAMAVSEARGVILLACQRAGLTISEYTPLQIKQAVTGYGKAGKKDVQNMVMHILALSEVPKPDDVADAIAVGLTHIFTLKV